MNPAIFACLLSVAAFAAESEELPTFDIEKGCHAGSSFVPEMWQQEKARCIKSESMYLKLLKEEWPLLPPAVQKKCADMGIHGYPAYQYERINACILYPGYTRP